MKDAALSISKQEPRVSTLPFVKKYAPDVQVIRPSDVDHVMGISQSQKTLIKRELLRGNVLHQVKKSGTNPERIIAPDKASPTMLSHEIGHHIERETNPTPESKISREVGAWKDAPKINTTVSAKIRDSLLKTYIEKKAMSTKLLSSARVSAMRKAFDARTLDIKPEIKKREGQAELFYKKLHEKIMKAS